MKNEKEQSSDFLKTFNYQLQLPHLSEMSRFVWMIWNLSVESEMCLNYVLCFWLIKIKCLFFL